MTSPRPRTSTSASSPRPSRPTRLAPRLRAVAEALPEGVSVADVGTGDGQLAAHLAAAGERRVIATEARPGPLARARAALAGSGVDVRSGDGLQPLRPGEVDAVVIAGLGGHRIASILAAAPEAVASLRLLVLQPVQHGEQLREWLGARHARLDERWAVQGRRRYRVLLVRPGA